MKVRKHSNHRHEWLFLSSGPTVGSGIAGGFADGPVVSARFNSPFGVAVDGAGNVFVADAGNNRIRKVDTAGNVTTIAGTGAFGFLDGPGASAQLNQPFGLDSDSAGNVFVADTVNRRIRKVDLAGDVTTIAGTGASGFINGPGASARFAFPTDVAVDIAGNLFVADASNHRIRKIS